MVEDPPAGGARKAGAAWLAPKIEPLACGCEVGAAVKLKAEEPPVDAPPNMGVGLFAA